MIKLRRSYRSLLLGCFALLAILWGLLYLLEVPAASVIGLLLASVLIVAGFALLAFLLVALLQLLKVLLRKR